MGAKRRTARSEAAFAAVLLSASVLLPLAPAAADTAPAAPTLALIEDVVEGAYVSTGNLRGELTAHNLTSQTLTRPLTAANLTGVRFVALTGLTVSYGDPYSQSEIDAVVAWVKAGGALFLDGDWYAKEEFGALAEPNFGIFYAAGILQDPTDNDGGEADSPVIHEFADHPIAEGLAQVVFFRGVSIARLREGAVGVAFSDNDSKPADAPVLATVVKGAGRVVAGTDGNAVNHWGVAQPYDNLQLLKNIVAWLLGDLEPGQAEQPDLPPEATGGAPGAALVEDQSPGGYVAAGTLRAELSNHGLTPRTMTRPITAEGLAGVQFVALTGINGAPSADEVAALVEWVEGGGALLLNGDIYSSDRFGSFAATEFGIEFASSAVSDPTNNDGERPTAVIVHVFGDHPVAEGVSEFVFFLGVSMRVRGGAVAVALTDDDSTPAGAALLATSVKAEGRVLAIGDGNAINDWGVSQEYDNRRLLENIVSWLLGELGAGQPALSEPSAAAQRTALPEVTTQAAGTVAPVVVLILVASTAAVMPGVPFAVLTLLAVPLFTRLRKDDVRNQMNRGRLLQFIADRPGASFSQLKRGLGMPNGACAYHLQVLARSGEIRRVVEGAAVRFYPADHTFEVDALPPLSYFQRQILELLVALPSGTAGAIGAGLRAKGFGVTDKNLGYHLRVLTREKELVSTRREEGKAFYFIEDEDRAYLARRLQEEARVDDTLEKVAASDAGPRALAQYDDERAPLPSGRAKESVAFVTDERPEAKSADVRAARTAEPRKPAVSPHFIPAGQSVAPARYP